MYEIGWLQSDETILFFLLTLLVGSLLYVVLKFYTKSKEIKERLEQIKSEPSSTPLATISLFKEQKESLIDQKIETYLKSVRTNKRLHFLGHIKENPHIFQVGLGSIPLFFTVSFGLKNFLKQDITIILLLSLPITFLLAHFVYKFLENRRKENFLKAFPHALDIITRGLRAGLSMEKAFLTIAKEIEGPVGKEFQAICDQMDLGIPYEEALNKSAIRVHLQDYSFFTSALIIQKNIGGSLAAFVENVASIIRRRDELRLKIRSLSSESKTTGIIIGALPFVTLLAISYLRPEHIAVFQNDPVGRKVILVALGMIITATLIINRLTAIDLQ